MYVSEEAMMLDKLRSVDFSKELLSFSWLSLIFAIILVGGQFMLDMSLLAELGISGISTSITTVIDVIVALLIAHFASFWVRIYFRNNIS